MQEVFMNFKVMKILFMLTIVVSGFISFLFISAETQEESVVAMVNGHQILYKDIKENPEVFRNFNPNMDKSQMEAAITEREKKRLTAIIRKTIMDQEIKKLGLQVTKEEVNLYMDKIFQKAGVTENTTREIAASYHALIDALESWQKNPSMSDDIYREQLESKTNITKKAWEIFKIQYNTPEKLDKLRLMIPKNLVDMKDKSFASHKKDLLYNKLREKITAGVTVQKEELEKYYSLKYKNLQEEEKANFEKIKDALIQELLARKKQEAETNWLQKQINKADIEIRDKKFKDVAVKLLEY